MGELQDQMVMAMRLRNFSAKTIKRYVSVVRRFVRKFGKSPAQMGEEEVRQYLQSLMERKASWSTIRQTCSVLKFLYRDTLKREWKVENLPHPKREKRLPAVFSTEEVKRLLDAVRNPKHRVVLMACYSACLRVSEAVHLKVTNIDSERMQIRVEQGKGKKDRYTLLGKTLLNELRSYWKVYRPEPWLFPGRNPGMPLSERTIENAFARAKKSGITKPVTVHSFRHSFATHLLASGTDIFVIQHLLGHSNIKTTSIYLHIQRASIEKIVNPLDRLMASAAEVR